MSLIAGFKLLMLLSAFNPMAHAAFEDGHCAVKVSFHINKDYSELTKQKVMSALKQKGYQAYSDDRRGDAAYSLELFSEYKDMGDRQIGLPVPKLNVGMYLHARIQGHEIMLKKFNEDTADFDTDQSELFDDGLKGLPSCAQSQEIVLQRSYGSAGMSHVDEIIENNRYENWEPEAQR